MVAKRLLDSGARMHSSDNLGFTAMDYAKMNKNYTMLDLLKSREK